MKRQRIARHPEVMTTSQVAKRIRLSERTVHKLFEKGEIRGYRLPGTNGDRRYHRSSVEALAERLGIPEPQTPETP